MTPKYDREADAIYISLAKAPYAYGKDLDKGGALTTQAGRNAYRSGRYLNMQLFVVLAPVRNRRFCRRVLAIARLLGKLHYSGSLIAYTTVSETAEYRSGR